MRPARLAYGIGKVGFAINRRTRDGPVDHDLPLLSITEPNGKVRGLWLSYACHCVVLSDFKVSGDWAGYASKELERLLPESIVLVSIGCDADSNPRLGVTGDKAGVAEQYGHDVAIEVERLLKSPLRPIREDVSCHLDKIQLPLQQLPTRDQWEERAKQPSYPGYYAKVMLQQLDAGEKLPTKIPLVVQTWKFEQSLASVFISGRSRCRLLPAAQEGIRLQAFVGECLFERRALLYPFRTRSQSRRLRGGRRNGVLRVAGTIRFRP